MVETQWWTRERLVRALEGRREMDEVLSEHETPGRWIGDLEDQPTDDGYAVVDLRVDVDHAIESLKPITREVVVRYYRLGRLQREIGEDMGLGPRKVSGLIEAGIVEMLDYLRDWEQK